MDGKPFSLPDGRTEKALCLPGSDKKSFLVGSHLLRTDPDPCFLVEGGPDWLAACWLAWRSGLIPNAPQWIPLGLLGAGCLIPYSQLERLRQRRVCIFAHGDGSGESAAENWTKQLLSARCTVEVFPIGELGLLQTDGNPVNDLNDVLRCRAEEVKAFTREVLR